MEAEGQIPCIADQNYPTAPMRELMLDHPHANSVIRSKFYIKRALYMTVMNALLAYHGSPGFRSDIQFNRANFAIKTTLFAVQQRHARKFAVSGWQYSNEEIM